MNTYKIEDLRTGMIFDKPVYLEDDILFIPSNIPLQKGDIERLRKWKIIEIETEGIITNEKDITLQSKTMWGVLVNQRFLELYNDLIAQYRKTYEKIVKGTGNLKDEVFQLAQRMVDAIDEDDNEFIRMVLSSTISAKDYPKRAIDCTVIALSITKAMKVEPEISFNTAVASLLHDIGMKDIPIEIIEKKGKLTGEELSQIHSHPLYSYQIIVSKFETGPKIAEIASQHHERWDGDGYPQGLKGEDIHLEARVLTVADAFEAMINTRPYRASMAGYDAIKSILSENSRRFDPAILKVFVKEIGIYPAGSFVALNDSSMCRVIEINARTPLRPIIRILIDSTGTEYSGDEGEVINMSERNNLFITHAININDLQR